MQDAYVARAARPGRATACPHRPGAWLTTVARRARAQPAAPRGARSRRSCRCWSSPRTATTPRGGRPTSIPDDRLRLVFTCCHPALGARGAGRAHAAAGLRRRDAATSRRRSSSAEPTMAARLTRAKKKIAAARIPYAVPAADELPGAARRGARPSIHLLYTTGHTAPSGRRARARRPDRAARSTSPACCVALLPDEREAARAARAAARPRRAPRRRAPTPHGRLRAARPTRTARRGTASCIAEADALIVAALRGRAARAASRCRRRSRRCTRRRRATRTTDWPQILALYDELLRVWPSPVVALNRAVALSMVDGPAAGARGGRGAGGATAGSPATATCPRPRPTCCAGSAADAEAAAAYREALALADNAAEQEFLAERLA